LASIKPLVEIILLLSVISHLLSILSNLWWKYFSVKRCFKLLKTFYIFIILQNSDQSACLFSSSQSHYFFFHCWGTWYCILHFWTFPSTALLFWTLPKVQSYNARYPLPELYFHHSLPFCLSHEKSYCNSRWLLDSFSQYLDIRKLSVIICCLYYIGFLFKVVF